MAEEWTVRVQGKEYGPVDADELRAWREDGRLIPTNEVRAAGTDQWFPAGELVEVFSDETTATPPPLPLLVRQASLGEILAQTWLLYRTRFWRFLLLSALVFVPSVCAQLSSAAVGSGEEVDFRTALADLFNFFMLLASLAAWPTYIAGLQILTFEASQGRPTTMGEILRRAVKFWWRVAFLCLLVYGAFFLLLVLAFAILVMVAADPQNPLVAVVALLLLGVQMWVFGRVFVNVLFWQQAAVLENAGVAESLRRSKEIAQSGGTLPWSQRPKWRGALLASLWCLAATALSIGPEWSMLSHYFHALTTMQDAQTIVQSMAASAKSNGLAIWPLALGVLQAILRPLLGIAFVLVYLESREWPNE